MKSPLQLRGMHKGRLLSCWWKLESGSTINLVSKTKKLCGELKLQVKRQNPVDIKLPNGDTLEMESSYLEFYWKTE